MVVGGTRAAGRLDRFRTYLAGADDGDLGWFVKGRGEHYLSKCSEDAEVLGKCKVGHHLDIAAAVRTRIGSSIDHLPKTPDNIVESLARSWCRHGSWSPAPPVPVHAARV